MFHSPRFVVSTLLSSDIFDHSISFQFKEIHRTLPRCQHGGYVLGWKQGIVELPWTERRGWPNCLKNTAYLKARWSVQDALCAFDKVRDANITCLNFEHIGIHTMKYILLFPGVSCCFWQRKNIRPWEILRAFHPKWNASAKSQLLVQCALSAHRVENSLTYQNPVRGLRKLSKQRHQVYQEYRHKTQKLWIWRWFQWLDGKSVRKFSAKASRWIPRSPSTDHKDRKNMELHFMILMNLALFWGKVGVGVHHGYRPDVRVARRIHCTDLEVVLHRPKETSYQNRVAMPHKSVKIPKRSQNVNKSWNCGSRMLQRLELWGNIDHSLSSINQDLFINFIPLSIGTVLISSGYVATCSLAQSYLTAAIAMTCLLEKEFT